MTMNGPPTRASSATAVGDAGPEDHNCRIRDDGADEREQRHRAGKSDGLTDRLIALTSRESGEVGDRQRHRPPERDSAREAGADGTEGVGCWLLACGCWIGQQWRPATGLHVRPDEQRDSDREQER
jgi:hypothetical protein